MSLLKVDYLGLFLHTAWFNCSHS